MLINIDAVSWMDFFKDWDIEYRMLKMQKRYSSIVISTQEKFALDKLQNSMIILFLIM